MKHTFQVLSGACQAKSAGGQDFDVLPVDLTHSIFSLCSGFRLCPKRHSSRYFNPSIQNPHPLAIPQSVRPRPNSPDDKLGRGAPDRARLAQFHECYGCLAASFILCNSILVRRLFHRGRLFPVAFGLLPSDSDWSQTSATNSEPYLS
jgi:hypothetical protein